MKRIFTTLLLFISLIFANVASASKIPTDELNYFKSTYKDIQVRFDGLIELSDGTEYIPVYPAEHKKVDKLSIIQTIPVNKSLADKPDFLMFNSNFAFFKLKKNDKKSTIIYNEKISDNVKLGLLPQDLLVPQGFEIPGELRIIIGDLVVPIQPIKEYKEINLLTGKEIKKTSSTDVSIINIEQLSDKYFYATSFNSNALTILNANTGKPFKKIEFSSIPTDVKLTDKGKYLLVSTWKLGKIFVIDSTKAKVLKEIEVGEKPTFISIVDEKNIAYVANSEDGTISLVDIESMKLANTISVIGNPTQIEIAKNIDDFYYLDAISGKVYLVEKQEETIEPYLTTPLFKANNIKKIQYYNNKIYTLDRGKNELLIYYINGKSNTVDTINISDITMIENQEENHSNLDYNYYNDDKQKSEKEKIPFKQKMVTMFKKLLYYKDDNSLIAENISNINNQVQIYQNSTISDMNTIQPIIENNTQNKKTFSQKFKEYMKYDYSEEEIEDTKKSENNKILLNQQMDFVKIQNRINDFFVINNKIYLLSADDSLVLIYDANTNNKIKTIELDKKGYYNSIKISQDGQLGAITNIMSNELTLFDINQDIIIEKLPLEVNAHNVVITGKNQ